MEEVHCHRWHKVGDNHTQHPSLGPHWCLLTFGYPQGHGCCFHPPHHLHHGWGSPSLVARSSDKHTQSPSSGPHWCPLTLGYPHGHGCCCTHSITAPWRGFTITSGTEQVTIIPSAIAQVPMGVPSPWVPQGMRVLLHPPHDHTMDGFHHHRWHRAGDSCRCRGHPPLGTFETRDGTRLVSINAPEQLVVSGGAAGALQGSRSQQRAGNPPPVPRGTSAMGVPEPLVSPRARGARDPPGHRQGALSGPAALGWARLRSLIVAMQAGTWLRGWRGHGVGKSLYGRGGTCRSVIERVHVLECVRACMREQACAGARQSVRV